MTGRRTLRILTITLAVAIAALRGDPDRDNYTLKFHGAPPNSGAQALSTFNDRSGAVLQYYEPHPSLGYRTVCRRFGCCAHGKPFDGATPDGGTANPAPDVPPKIKLNYFLSPAKYPVTRR
jgi:hypothetical protein